MYFILHQQKAAGIFYTIMGRKPSIKDVEYFARKLESGVSDQNLATMLMNSKEAQARLAKMSNTQKATFIYKNIYEQAPSSSELQPILDKLNAGKKFSDVAISIFTDLYSYKGTDMNIREQQYNLMGNIAEIIYPSDVLDEKDAAAAKEINALYYALSSVSNGESIQYWAHLLQNANRSLTGIAQQFVEMRPKVFGAMDNAEFVLFVYKKVFLRLPDDDTFNDYLMKLEYGTNSRGEITVAIIEELRAAPSCTDGAAKQQLCEAEHVYKAGELPKMAHLETIASLYLAIAGRGVDADGLSSWSKLLASGESTYEVLSIMAKSHEFRNAADFQSVYYKLHGSSYRLTELDSKVILRIAGGDALKATVLIIESFRKGDSLLLDNTPVSEDLQLEFLQAVIESLGYRPELPLYGNNMVQENVPEYLTIDACLQTDSNEPITDATSELVIAQEEVQYDTHIETLEINGIIEIPEAVLNLFSSQDDTLLELISYDVQSNTDIAVGDSDTILNECEQSPLFVNGLEPLLSTLQPANNLVEVEFNGLPLEIQATNIWV